MLLAASIGFTFALTADATQGEITLRGRVFNAKTGEVVSAVPVLAFVVAPQQPNVIAQDTTDANGRFALVVDATTPLEDVRLRLGSSLTDPCATLRILGVVSLASAYAARSGGDPFVVSPRPSATNSELVARTFEPIGWVEDVDPCSWRLGSAGLFKHRDLE